MFGSDITDTMISDDFTPDSILFQDMNDEAPQRVSSQRFSEIISQRRGYHYNYKQQLVLQHSNEQDNPLLSAFEDNAEDINCMSFLPVWQVVIMMKLWLRKKLDMTKLPNLTIA